MAGYRPDIPPHVADVIRGLPPEVKRGVKAAIRALSGEPAAGEPLQRELEGLWKYRVKRFRVVYAVDRQRRVLQIMAIGHRRLVYEELAERVRRRQSSRDAGR
jgi:mRNA interferase RelE/StbE